LNPGLAEGSVGASVLSAFFPSRPGAAMYSLYLLIDTVLNLYSWCLIVWVIMSWLISFNVINTHNRFVHLVGDFLYRITEPLLRPIRRFLPNLGGLDLSPIVLILLVWFARNLLSEYWGRAVYG
jgi:YggT family protein